MNKGMLDEFCHVLMAHRSRSLQPTDVAREFVDFFGLSAFPRMEEITALLDTAGVGAAVCSRLPGGIRGVHTGTKNGRYLIEYNVSDWSGAQEHTLLHETYEIVRERLRDLHPEAGFSQGASLCRQADRFAAAALMQPALFGPFAEAVGLDVVALQRRYGRAYSSLTIRLAEVMQHQPLLAVLYERKEEGDPRRWTSPARAGRLQGHGRRADARVQAEDAEEAAVVLAGPASPQGALRPPNARWPSGWRSPAGPSTWSGSAATTCGATTTSPWPPGPPTGTDASPRSPSSPCPTATGPSSGHSSAAPPSSASTMPIRSSDCEWDATANAGPATDAR